MLGRRPEPAAGAAAAAGLTRSCSSTWAGSRACAAYAEDGDALVIGAMTTHDEVTRTHWSRQHAGCCRWPPSTVADPQVRHRGTFGGSLAHGDPAGDMGAAALALDAEMVIVGAVGQRTVPAREFFTDLFTTAVGSGELLTEIRVPDHTGWGAHYEKLNRTAQGWSIVAVAAVVKVVGRHHRAGQDRADQHGPGAAARCCRGGRTRRGPGDRGGDRGRIGTCG